MALIHEFENSGNWLFKRRGWLPVLIFIPALLYIYLSGAKGMEYKPWLEMICLSVSLFGQLIRGLTLGRTPKNTSGRNINKQLADELNTSGIYSIIRHPLYLGNFFMWLGPVLFLRSISFFLVFSLVYWLYYERIMFAEEQFLRRKFRDAYDLWSEKVKSFLPSFRNYSGSKLPFSFKNVLKREYNGFFSVFLVFAILDSARNFCLEGEININLLWLILFCFGFLCWIILRTLKKKTKLLNVKGR